MIVVGLLEGKTALVTGASKGIGKGIAKTFLTEGARVMIAGRGEEQLRDAVRDLSAYGEVFSCPADVSRADDAERLVKDAASRMGSLDVLCSNAGIFPMSTIAKMSEEEWDQINAVNVKGLFLCVRAAVPIMKAQGGGAVLITSSITGPITGFTGWSHYGATKAAQLGFMRSAAIELAPYGIRVNAVQPGNVLTEGLQGLGEEYLETMAKSIPLGSLGTPEDIGYAMAFLGSDKARFITGQALVVDGGQILPESSDAMGVIED